MLRRGINEDAAYLHRGHDDGPDRPYRDAARACVGEPRCQGTIAPPIDFLFLTKENFMAIEESETGNLIGSDKVQGTPSMEPTTKRSVQSRAS